MVKKIKLKEIYQDGSVTGVAKLSAQGKELCQSSAELYKQVGFRKPWIAYLAIDGEFVVGVCAFKGVPQDGTAEVTFLVLPDFRGKGFATAMVTSLIRMAKQSDPKLRLVAETSSEESAATAILNKLKFQRFEPAASDKKSSSGWHWQLEKS